MSEIDPQSGDPLVKALKRLAASSQQGASAEIGAGLAAAFRQHHRRKRIRRMSIAGLVACVAAIAGLFILRTTQTSQTPQRVQNVTQTHIEPAKAPVQAPEVTQTASKPAETPKPVRKPSHPQVTTSTVAYSREFIALPGYDPSVPAEDLHIVRAQLPTSTLWQMGAPINPAGPERRVLADFVIGQDGTPYGVRLVQTKSF